MVSDHCEYCGHRSAHYPSCRPDALRYRAALERIVINTDPKDDSTPYEIARAALAGEG